MCSRKQNTVWRSLLLTQWHVPSRQVAVKCLVNSIKHSSKYECSTKNICTPQKVTVVNKLLLQPVSKTKKRREKSTPGWTLATIARSPRPGETWCLCAIHGSVAKIIHIYRFGILKGLHHLQHHFCSIRSVLSTRCHNIRGCCVLRLQPHFFGIWHVLQFTIWGRNGWGQQVQKNRNLSLQGCSFYVPSPFPSKSVFSISYKTHWQGCPHLLHIKTCMRKLKARSHKHRQTQFWLSPSGLCHVHGN